MSATVRSDQRLWDALAACGRALSGAYGADDVDEVVCASIVSVLERVGTDGADATAGAAALTVSGDELVSAFATGALARAGLRVPLTSGLRADLAAGRVLHYSGGLAAVHAATEPAVRSQRLLLVPVLCGDRLVRVLAGTSRQPDGPDVATAGDGTGRTESGLSAALTALGATASIAYAAHPESWTEELVYRSPDAVLMLARDGTVRTASRGLGRLLATDPHTLVGVPIVDLVHPDDAERVLSRLGRACTHFTGEAFEMRCGRADGGWVKVEAAVVTLLGASGVRRIVVRLRDLRERNALEAELSYWARHDPRTGLANRTLLHVRLGEAAAQASARGVSLVVVLVGLAGVRELAGRVGSDVADAALAVVADRLRACVRDVDTVARVGDNEFAIVTAGRADSADALVQRVSAALRDPVPLGTGQARLRASIGVRVADPEDAAVRAPEQLVRDAELAMHAAQESGDAEVRRFHHDMHRNAELQHLIHAELPDAVANGQLELHYQPIVNLESRRTAGFEALVRWRHPERGLIPPDGFIPHAERSGAIGQVGAWVLERACADAARICAAGGREQVISVNISPLQLESDDVLRLLAEALTRHGLAPSTLCAEITESALVRGRSTVDRLRQLRELGLHLALDDFGTGYASYGQLQALPVDTMKIDRSFTARLSGNERTPALAREMIRMGRSLGLRIVAEGVETAEQEAELAALGCPFGQGYLFGRPVPLDEVLARLRAESKQPSRVPAGSQRDASTRRSSTSP